MNHVQAQDLIYRMLWTSGMGSKGGAQRMAGEVLDRLEQEGVLRFEKPTVLVVRDPDAPTSITVSPEGSVTVVEVDLGSSFDSHPRDRDEADAADEIANRVMLSTQHLPHGDRVRQAALYLAESLREQAAEARL